jgi:SAM-dependent methyltransferase
MVDDDTRVDMARFWDDRYAHYWNLAGSGNYRLGRWYNFWKYLAQRRVFLEVLRRHKISLRGKAVLDVGCGTGYWTRQCMCLGARRIVGLDISALACQRLQQQYPDTAMTTFAFETVDIAQDPFPIVGPFDLLLAYQVLFHVLDAQGFEQALRNLIQVACPGAYLLIADAFPGEDRAAGSYLYFRSYETYERVLTDHGITVLELLVQGYLLDWPIHLGSRELRDLRWRYLAPLFYFADGGLRKVKPCLGLQSNFNLLVCRVGE